MIGHNSLFLCYDWPHLQMSQKFVIRVIHIFRFTEAYFWYCIKLLIKLYYDWYRKTISIISSSLLCNYIQSSIIFAALYTYCLHLLSGWQIYDSKKYLSSLNLAGPNYMFQIIIYQVIKSSYIYINVFVLIKANLEFAIYKKNAPQSKLHILK